MVEKSLQYANDENASQHSSKFVLLCEVALGNSKEFKNPQPNYELEQGYDSIVGLGREGPEQKD